MSDGISSEEKRKIIAVITALIPEAKIYLFGSRARGYYNNGSDVDLALDTGQRIQKIRLGEVRDLLNNLSVGYFFDVVDFNKANPEFREEIERGKVIWKD